MVWLCGSAHAPDGKGCFQLVSVDLRQLPLWLGLPTGSARDSPGLLVATPPVHASPQASGPSSSLSVPLRISTCVACGPRQRAPRAWHRCLSTPFSPPNSQEPSRPTRAHRGIHTSVCSAWGVRQMLQCLHYHSGTRHNLKYLKHFKGINSFIRHDSPMRENNKLFRAQRK